MWTGVRGAMGIVAAMTALAGCRGNDSLRSDPDIGHEFPDEDCTQLAAATYEWEGMPSVCGAGGLLRELLPIGDGLVLDWRPKTQEGRVWAVGTTEPLGDTFVTGGPSPGLLRRTVLLPIGKRRLLLAQPDHVNVSIFTVNPESPPGSDPLMSSLGEADFQGGFFGRGVIGLDDDFLIDYRTGDGTYIIHHVNEEARNTPGVLTTANFHGTREFLRRGARFANLGQHRLLEWIPVTRHYRIWSYGFGADRDDIFDEAPVAEGDFSDVGPSQEILAVSTDRILVWDRQTGHIQLRVLDPLSSNPLGGALVSEKTYERLLSPDWEAPANSAIKNLVIVLQRGRSFDSYFGQYCQAPAGTQPACEDGPGCCEAMPASVPGASACVPLDPTQDLTVPHEDATCLATKIHGGQMTEFAVPPCGAPADFACTPTGDAAGATAFYHHAAAAGALADRYFQSTLDGAEPNAIYLSKTAYGQSIPLEWGTHVTRTMAEAGVRWAIYLDEATSNEGLPPPIFFDHHWDFFRGVSEIDRDVDLEQLGAISVVIAGPSESEQPGAGPAEVGVRFAEHVVEKVLGSPRYAGTTLVLLTHLTAGGFFDHVAPPPPVPLAIDTRDDAAVEYGPRVPLLALGPFARANHVSHVPLELSSVTRFMEWNWKDGVTGMLNHRDMIVSNLGSLLDATKTGTPVP